MKIRPLSENQRIYAGFILVAFIMVAMPVLLKPIAGASDQPGLRQLLVSEIYPWFLLGCIYLICSRIEKNGIIPSDQKQELTFYKMLFHAIALFSALLALAVFTSLVARMFHFKTDSSKLEKIISILKAHKYMIVLIPVTAGVVEEFIFRAYLLTRIETVTKRSWIAVVLSSVLFGIGHIGYGTVSQIVFPFLLGILFSVHYLKYRNIGILIIVHFLWDFSILLTKTGMH